MKEEELLTFEPWEDEFIRTNLGRMRAVKVARKLGCETWDVYARAKAMGIKYRYMHPRVVWTTSMERTVRELYPTKTASEIGRVLGVDRRVVQRRALAIGLRKAK